MASKSDPPGALRSLSVRQLILIFFGAVGVCAVFFALGFLVGSNGRTPNPSAPQVERVAPPSEIPPTVNQPLESSNSGGDRTGFETHKRVANFGIFAAPEDLPYNSFLHSNRRDAASRGRIYGGKGHGSSCCNPHRAGCAIPGENFDSPWVPCSPGNATTVGGA